MQQPPMLFTTRQATLVIGFFCTGLALIRPVPPPGVVLIVMALPIAILVDFWVVRTWLAEPAQDFDRRKSLVSLGLLLFHLAELACLAIAWRGAKDFGRFRAGTPLDLAGTALFDAVALSFGAVGFAGAAIYQGARWKRRECKQKPLHHWDTRLE